VWLLEGGGEYYGRINRKPMREGVRARGITHSKREKTFLLLAKESASIAGRQNTTRSSRNKNQNNFFEKKRDGKEKKKTKGKRLSVLRWLFGSRGRK